MNSSKRLGYFLVCFIFLLSIFVTLDPGKVEAATSFQQHMYTHKSTVAYASRSTHSKKVFSIPHQVYVEQLEVYKGWSKIQYNERIGWVASSTLSPLLRHQFAKTKTKAIVYKTKSTKTKQVATLPSNTNVEVMGTYSSWTLITFENKTGWVPKNTLSFTLLKESFIPRPYFVRTNSPLYSSVGSTRKKLMQIPSETKVMANERYGDWLLVTHNNQKGWVYAKNTIPLSSFVVDAKQRNYGDTVYTDRVKDLYQKHGVIHMVDEETLSYGLHGDGFSQVFALDFASEYRYVYIIGREDTSLARQVAAQSLVRLGVDASSKEILTAINKAFTGEIVDVGNAWIVADGLGAAVRWN